MAKRYVTENLGLGTPALDKEGCNFDLRSSRTLKFLYPMKMLVLSCQPVLPKRSNNVNENFQKSVGRGVEN